MTDCAYIAQSARCAWVMRSVTQACRASPLLLVLILNHPAMAAGTPLNCAEGKNRIVCIDVPTVQKPTIVVDDKEVSVDDTPGVFDQKRTDLVIPNPTPGRQVKQMPLDDFLPFYFTPRRSQIGM